MCRLVSALLACLLAGSLWAPSPRAQGGGQGQSTYQRPEKGQFARHLLAFPHEFAAVYAHDLTGNGLDDLVVVQADRTERATRMFAQVFLQEPGTFTAAGDPQALPADLALAGVGRFAGEPALALLLPSGVELWPWAGETFHPDRARRIAVESVFPVPAGEVIPNMEWVADLNGDGDHELVVPGFGALLVLSPNGPAEADAAPEVLPVPPRVRFWRGFVRPSVAHTVPTTAYVDIDGNGWRDVVAFSEDQLFVYQLGLDGEAQPRTPHLHHDLVPPEPFDPEAPWKPPLKLIKAEDINGDGLLDLVVSRNAPNDRELEATSSTMVYYGRAGPDGLLGPYGETPDQVYVAEGFALPLLIDLNDDGRTDLIQVNVPLSFWNAVRAVVTRTVKAEAAFYVMDGGGAYPRQPDELESYAVSFSLTRFGHQPIATWGDLNGDGLPDLLLSADKEQLGIHWGRPGGFWDGDEDALVQDWLPLNQKRLHVLDLNHDDRMDLMLTYVRDDNRRMPETLRRLIVLLSLYPEAANGN